VGSTHDEKVVSMRRRLVGLAVAGAFGSAALGVIGAIPAAAVPSYCSASQSGNGARAYCYASAAGTQFRAVAACVIYLSSGGTDHANFYGSWQTQGDPYSSLGTCGSGWSFSSANAQTR
jgi:hypothetical protein